MFFRNFSFLFYHVMWKQGIIASIWHIGCTVWPIGFGVMSSRKQQIEKTGLKDSLLWTLTSQLAACFKHLFHVYMLNLHAEMYSRHAALVCEESVCAINSFFSSPEQFVFPRRLALARAVSNMKTLCVCVCVRLFFTLTSDPQCCCCHLHSPSHHHGIRHPLRGCWG